MVFTVDGINIVPFIEEGGIKWTANGIDGPKAGRALNALMYRNLVGYKARADITCLWMDRNEAQLLYNSLMKEFFTIVTDTIPWESGTVAKTVYSNNLGITLSEEYTDGSRVYSDLSFPLIER